jgi:hypothetical protein
MEVLNYEKIHVHSGQHIVRCYMENILEIIKEFEKIYGQAENWREGEENYILVLGAFANGWLACGKTHLTPRAADGFWLCEKCGCSNPPVRLNCHHCQTTRR